MAEGYAHATGRPGRGHGHERSGGDEHRHAARRRLPGLDPARRDHRPGRARARSAPTRSRSATRVGITMPVTKHNWLITDAQDIPRIVREAFHVATTGRPGPVLVDIPKDVANQTMDWEWPDSVDLPGLQAEPEGPPEADQGGGAADQRGAPSGDLRGRRHPEGPRGRGAARARRAHRHPGGHDAHGPRRVPRRPRAARSACRACTATTPRSPRCRRPTCSSRSARASTTG